MAKRNIHWGRIVAIALIITVVDIVLHSVGQEILGIHPDYQAIVMPTYTVEPNPVGDKEWAAKNFLPYLALTFILTFVFLTAIFNYIQDRLPGKRMAKGFRYGIAFWGLWAFGICEWHYIYQSGWLYDLFNTAFLDGAFMLAASLAAARFVATDSPSASAKSSKIETAVVPIVAILYVAGRYANYSVFDIVNAQHIEPVKTFICLALVGLWIGVMYRLLDPAFSGWSAAKRALMFGVVIFGTNWWFFAQFELLLMQISWTDPVLRVGVDVIMVSLGVFVFEKFIRKTA